MSRNTIIFALALLASLALAGCKSPEEKAREKIAEVEAMKASLQAEQALAEMRAPEVGTVTLENARNGCKAYVEITPKQSGFSHHVEVKFLFKDAQGAVLHMMPWTINRPVAGQTETIKGWWHGHGCSDFTNVEVTARAK